MHINFSGEVWENNDFVQCHVTCPVKQLSIVVKGENCWAKVTDREGSISYRLDERQYDRIIDRLKNFNMFMC